MKCASESALALHTYARVRARERESTSTMPVEPCTHAPSLLGLKSCVQGSVDTRLCARGGAVRTFDVRGRGNDADRSFFGHYAVIARDIRAHCRGSRRGLRGARARCDDQRHRR